MTAINDKRACQCGKVLSFATDAYDDTTIKHQSRRVVRCSKCGRIYGLDLYRTLQKPEHPVTRKIRMHPSDVSPAQRRALRLAAVEGSLCYHRDRWAPPSRAWQLGPDAVVGRPFERGASVHGLERRGLLQPDPRYERGELNIPRPRVITDKGRAFIRTLDAKLITDLAVRSVFKYNHEHS